jgi:hypothetical protein
MIPAAIVFISDNLTDQVRDTIATQLYITTIMSGPEYDAYVALDPLYPDTIHNSQQRIMVIRELSTYTNRETADVVLFFAHGNVSVEENKFGPPGCTWRASEVHWGKLAIYGIPSANCACCC